MFLEDRGRRDGDPGLEGMEVVRDLGTGRVFGNGRMRDDGY